MKYLLLVSTLLLSSCTDFWYDSTQMKFKEACSDEAAKWSSSPEQTNAYCDCLLEKMMKKYPNDEDAIAHLGELSADTSLINCREQIMNK